MGRGNKPVKYYSKDGEFIKEFPSITAASEETGYSKTVISEVCRNIYNHSECNFEYVNAEDNTGVVTENGLTTTGSRHTEINAALKKFPPVFRQTPQQLAEYKTLLEARLNPNQIRFSTEYIFGDYMGNATRAYMKAYNVRQDQIGGNSSALLKKVHVLEYINYLMYEAGWSPKETDTQLLFLIKQHEDLGVKLNAIKEFNKLHGRITDRLQIEDNRNSVDLSNLSDAELDIYLKLHEKATGTKEIEEAEYEDITD